MILGTSSLQNAMYIQLALENVQSTHSYLMAKFSAKSAHGL